MADDVKRFHRIENERDLSLSSDQAAAAAKLLTTPPAEHIEEVANVTAPQEVSVPDVVREYQQRERASYIPSTETNPQPDAPEPANEAPKHAEKHKKRKLHPWVPTAIVAGVGLGYGAWTQLRPQPEPEPYRPESISVDLDASVRNQKLDLPKRPYPANLSPDQVRYKDLLIAIHEVRDETSFIAFTGELKRWSPKAKDEAEATDIADAMLFAATKVAGLRPNFEKRVVDALAQRLPIKDLDKGLSFSVVGAGKKPFFMVVNDGYHRDYAMENGVRVGLDEEGQLIKPNKSVADMLKRIRINPADLGRY